MTASDLPSFTGPVGVFPLPNTVLFPGATLPLHIHEPRYRSMVRDALADEAVIAMALLRPGYEAYYYTNRAGIHPVVCVGRIREHVRIPDGRYFINLLGLCRARVRQEDRHGEYRLAMLEPMIRTESGIEADGEYAARESLRRVLSLPAFDAIDGIEIFRMHVDSEVSLGTVVDGIASGLLPAENVEIRQRLLEEMNALRRAEALLPELAILRATLEMRQRSQSTWPRFGPMN